jgi:Glutathione S-transferase, N-terminal domain
MSVPRIVLYRCRTPTNVLCPCGAVARRLGRLGLDYRTERLPYRRRRRPEIEELTRQRRIPVLVDGEEVIHDSKRILQYLDWKYGKSPKGHSDGASDEVAGHAAEPAAPSAPEPADTGAQGEDVGGVIHRLYNVKRWIRPKRQSS